MPCMLCRGRRLQTCAERAARFWVVGAHVALRYMGLLGSTERTMDSVTPNPRVIMGLLQNCEHVRSGQLSCQLRPLERNGGQDTDGTKWSASRVSFMPLSSNSVIESMGSPASDAGNQKMNGTWRTKRSARRNSRKRSG